MSSTSSLRKNAVLNTIRQICSIIYPMITFPYVSRILGLDNYGKISFSSSIVSYILMIAALGITNYSIREGSRIKDHREELEKFCNQIFSINIVSMTVAYLILFALILFWRRLDGYTALLLIQALTILFITAGTDWINYIFEDYEYITIRYIVCQGIAVLMMLLLVHRREDYIIYAATSSIGTILANLMNVGYVRRHFRIHPHFTVHMDLRRNFRPIMMLFGSSIATTIYVNSDITILGLLKGDKEAGLYTASSKFYTMVKQLLNASLTVAIPRISHERAVCDKKTVDSHLSRIIGDLIVLSFPAAAGLFSLAKPLVVLFSGPEYQTAYSSLQILSISLIFATMASFFINVIMISFGMEDRVLYATVASAILNIVLNFVLIPSMGQNAAALTTLLSEMLIVILGAIWTRNCVHISFGKSFLISVIELAVVLLLCGQIQKLRLGNLFTIAISMVACVVACALILFLLDRERFNEIMRKRRHNR